MEEWPTAVSPAVGGFRFRIQYPSKVAVDTTAFRDRRLLRFTRSGPNNQPPALTDGFSLTISLRPRSTEAPLDSLAQRQITETRRAGGEVITPVRAARFQDRPSRRWTQESAMGNAVEHRIIALDDHALATTTVSVVGTDTARYTRTITSMLQTLRFATASESTRTEPSDDPTLSSDPKIQVSLAFLRDPRGEPERGCDDVVQVERWVRVTSETTPSPSARLEVALRTLLSIDTDSVEGHRHFLARTNETLSLDSVSVENSVAKVYLHGTLSGLQGACDNPRGRIQIEETARALRTIDRVLLYRNGRRTDLTPTGRGGGEKPRR